MVGSLAVIGTVFVVALMSAKRNRAIVISATLALVVNLAVAAIAVFASLAPDMFYQMTLGNQALVHNLIAVLTLIYSGACFCSICLIVRSLFGGDLTKPESSDGAT